MSRRLIFWLAFALALTLATPQMIRKLIYHPDPAPGARQMKELQADGFLPFPEPVGSPGFRGYLRAPAEPDRLILIFHGNAGTAADRHYMTIGLPGNAAVYLAEYPGYGGRQGDPSETSLFLAALTDLELLRKKYPDLPLIVMGESLGTGVASKIAAQTDARALVLISPFTSLAAVGKIHYPFLPVNVLLKDRFDSVENLKGLGAPLLVLHGDRDEIVPHALGKKLHDGYGGPKKLVTLAGLSHNDLAWDHRAGELWTEIRDWIEANAPAKK